MANPPIDEFNLMAVARRLLPGHQNAVRRSLQRLGNLGPIDGEYEPLTDLERALTDSCVWLTRHQEAVRLPTRGMLKPILRFWTVGLRKGVRRVHPILWLFMEVIGEYPSEEKSQEELWRSFRSQIGVMEGELERVRRQYRSLMLRYLNSLAENYRWRVEVHRVLGQGMTDVPGLDIPKIREKRASRQPPTDREAWLDQMFPEWRSSR